MLSCPSSLLTLSLPPSKNNIPPTPSPDCTSILIIPHTFKRLSGHICPSPAIPLSTRPAIAALYSTPGPTSASASLGLPAKALSNISPVRHTGLLIRSLPTSILLTSERDAVTTHLIPPTSPPCTKGDGNTLTYLHDDLQPPTTNLQHPCPTSSTAAKYHTRILRLTHLSTTTQLLSPLHEPTQATARASETTLCTCGPKTHRVPSSTWANDPSQKSTWITRQFGKSWRAQ